MEVRQLEYVVGVVERGGFTRAARDLHVSQPALSQGVRTLEAELGVELFHRMGRRVELTAAGRALLGPARQVLRDTLTVRAAVAAVRGVVAGSLDLVALATLAVDPVARLVGTFRAAYPGVAVRVASPEEAADVAELVGEGAAELGLAELPVTGSLCAHELLVQEIVAVCPPGTVLPRGRRLRLQRLAGMPLVTTPPGTSTRRLVDEAFACAGLSANVAVETAHRDAVVALVLAGAGAAFVPESTARAAEAAGAAVAAIDPPVRRSIGVVHRRGPLSPAAKAFIDLAL
ncbi:MAG: LysR family transcriptional regulator [Acidimicrobiales bacterium]